MTSVSALEALFVGNPEFEEIEKSRDVFCPFEAVGVVRHEIRHAHFLAYCLDPYRPHGFGSDCLQALMRAAASAQRLSAGDVTESQITPLDVHLMNLDGAQVRREWRNIDLLIVVDEEKLVIPLELKIDASEHSGQLNRYRQLVEEEWPISSGWRHLFIFLTKHGDDASDDSGGNWLPLPLASLAIEFDGLVRKQVGNIEARSLLASYLAMLRRHHLTDSHLEQLASKLWSQHREALEFLMERRPDAGDGLYGQLSRQRVELAEMMSQESGLEVIAEDDAPASIMRFAVTKWDAVPNMLTAQRWTNSNRVILLEIQKSGDKRSIRMRFVLGPSTPEIRNGFYAALQSAGVAVSRRKTITGIHTRLDTVLIAKDLDDEDFDIELAVEKAIQAIRAYSRRLIPAYDRGLELVK